MENNTDILPLKLIRMKAFKAFLIRETGCDLDNSFPCRRCTLDLLNDLGIKVSRINPVWRAINDMRTELESIESDKK
jgi:hypothetical protein